MTKFLWTGESEYCKCGHHVTEHETDIQASLLNVADPPTVYCRWDCQCGKFRPYRTIGEEDNDNDSDNDKEVIEKQNWEVKKY
jgi:hypothetical protein